MMLAGPRLRGGLAAAAGLVLAACASTPAREPRWEPVVLHEGDRAFERVRTGRPDPSDPGLQVVGVDQAGRVVVVTGAGTAAPRASVVHDHGCELTGLVVADVDPAIPGEEIYAGGFAAPDPRVGGPGDRQGIGGAVLQIVLSPGGTRVRRVFEGDAYVHSIERMEPASPGDPPRLLVSTYRGEVRLLTPASGDGPWPGVLLHREPPSADPEAPKVKDAAFLRDPSGRATREVLLVLKTGRAVLLDCDRPGSGRLVHEEPGGLSRVTADPDGGAWVTGYAGRVLRFTRDGAGFRVEAVHHSGKDSGLRGVVLGRFPVPGGVAPMAIFGFDRLVRTLTPRLGARDTFTIFADAGRGHAVEAADLVPGNDADEIVVAGYSMRITLLVHRP